jgi:hypothetical protein
MRQRETSCKMGEIYGGEGHEERRGPDLSLHSLLNIALSERLPLNRPLEGAELNEERKIQFQRSRESTGGEREGTC